MGDVKYLGGLNCL